MWPVLHRGGGGETGNAHEMGRPRSEPSPPRGGGGGSGRAGPGQRSPGGPACSGAARAGANRPPKGLGSDALAIARATRPARPARRLRRIAIPFTPRNMRKKQLHLPGKNSPLFNQV